MAAYTGIAHLWQHGGFMPNGVQGILMSMQMVMFAYLGVEMIGLTAGEAKKPAQDAGARGGFGVLAHSDFLCRRAVCGDVDLPVE